MLRDTPIGHRVWGIVGALSAVLFASAGELHAQGLICRGAPFPVLPALGLVTSNPISCTVNCSAGGTIASAIAMKPRTTNTLTITIRGTCAESVDHVPSDVTLQAGTSGATLQAPNSSTDPVLGISGIGVTLTNLTISGGINALRGRSGSAFTGNDLVVDGASNADILLNHADLTLNTSTVQNSAGDGIQTLFGSGLFLNGGGVQQNAGSGVVAEFDGSAHLFGGAVLQSNGVRGAYAVVGGAIDISAASVTNNAFGIGGIAGIDVGSGGHLNASGSGVSVSSNGGLSGIDVFGGSAILTGATIANNLLNGITIREGAVAHVTDAVIQGNGSNGIDIESGNLRMGDTSGPVLIQSNKANGILMRNNSVAGFLNTSNKIINNTGWGIFCTPAPSNPLLDEPLGTVGTVSGNGAGQIHCNVSP